MVGVLFALSETEFGDYFIFMLYNVLTFRKMGREVTEMQCATSGTCILVRLHPVKTG